VEGLVIFNLNNSFLLDTDSKDRIKHAITEIRSLNIDRNPLVRWEVIKSQIRNETVLFQTEHVGKLTREIIIIETEIDCKFDKNLNRNVELKKLEQEQFHNENISGIIMIIEFKLDNLNINCYIT
jgi:hypothetical protein